MGEIWYTIHVDYRENLLTDICHVGAAGALSEYCEGKVSMMRLVPSALFAVVFCGAALAADEWPLVVIRHTANLNESPKVFERLMECHFRHPGACDEFRFAGGGHDTQETIYTGRDFRPILEAPSGPGRRPVGIRPGAGFYTEAQPRDMVKKCLSVAREAERRRGYGALAASVCYEQETYPRHVLHKSPGAIITECALALASGCNSLSLYWYTNAAPEPIEEYDRFVRALATARPYFRRLADSTRRTRLGGVARFVGSAAAETAGFDLRDNVDFDLACAGVPVTVAESGTKVWYITGKSRSEMTEADKAALAAGSVVSLDGVGRFPLASRRRKLLDDLDVAAKGAFPVRVDACRALRILPRVRDNGMLDSVTVLNLSIGDTDEIEVRVRNPASGRAFWQDAKLSAPVPVALRPGASANERVVKIANLSGWQIGTIFFGAPDPYEYKDLVTREVAPAKMALNASGRMVADFGRDAVGWLELDGPCEGPYEIVLGELVNGGGEVTNAYPRSSIRCQRLKGVKQAGRHRVAMPPDVLNLKGYDPKAPAVRLPESFGVVFPFRYAEVLRGPEMSMRQIAVNYPIDMGRSSFDCDNADLVRVYELCKYSILATSFCGVYVDGDRERTPYEADAYINQLGHYAIDDDCSLARKSHEWLMNHPTWPTEWRQHSVKMAWADLMWTGDARSAEKLYDRLCSEKLMAGFARPGDGLLETGGERKKGAKPGASDIVDWPSGERDNFVFRPVNAVVNAFYYRNLEELSDIAKALGRSGDAKGFTARAGKIRAAFDAAFYRPERGLYADGEGTDHCSLHANAAALAFGLVPEERVSGVADFLVRKGMACSVYFAQYLLEALFEAGRDEVAVGLMAAHGGRSWLGMADFGSTVTMEAWNIDAKCNLDLNHAWGAAPLNIISRYVVGVTPLEPGFRTISIHPRLGGLKRLSATVPTAAGPVTVEATPDALAFESPSPVVAVFAGETRRFPPGRHAMARRRKN